VVLLENRQAQNDTISVSTTSIEIFSATPTRDYFSIYNGTAGEVMTIKLGDGDAIDNEGVVLSYGQSYGQSDSASFKAWRGRICAISTGATNVSRQATFME